VKLLELRDRNTFIPVMAIRLSPRDPKELWLLARAGYGGTQLAQEQYVFLINLVDGPYDPFNHGSARTLRDAHVHLQEHFDAVPAGSVLDVEFLHGETPAAKSSEQLLEP